MNKRKANDSSQRTDNQNFFAPLQTIDDDDNDENVIEPPVKNNIPPITILKCKIEQVHEVCRYLKIDDYSIRKISIGLKLFCSKKEDFTNVCESLTKMFHMEYFTYAAKNEKPYKAVLLGLDKSDPSVIKAHLLKLGLKVMDVKIVTRGRDSNNEQIIFIVYFEKKSITLKELRQKPKTQQI